MSVSNFPYAFGELTKALRRLSAAVSAISTGTGPIPLAQVNSILTAFEGSVARAIEVQGELAIATDAAVAHMQSIQGPSSVVEFNNLFQAIDGAAKAWNAQVKVALEAGTNCTLTKRVVVTGVEVSQMSPPTAIAQAQSDTLRQSQELVELMAAINAAGF